MWRCRAVQAILSSFGGSNGKQLTLTFSRFRTCTAKNSSSSDLVHSTAILHLNPAFAASQSIINYICCACCAYCLRLLVHHYPSTTLHLQSILPVNIMRSTRTLIVLTLALCAFSARAQDPANNQQQGGLLNYLQGKQQLFTHHMFLACHGAYATLPRCTKPASIPLCISLAYYLTL
jgi:hypothetical protein